MKHSNFWWSVVIWMFPIFHGFCFAIRIFFLSRTGRAFSSAEICLNVNQSLITLSCVSIDEHFISNKISMIVFFRAGAWVAECRDSRKIMAISSADGDEVASLLAAARSADLVTIQHLLDNTTVHVDSFDDDHVTALQLAAACNHRPVVSLIWNFFSQTT